VIPIYREHMTEYEKISLLQCCRVLSRYDISFVAPANLRVDKYLEFLPQAKIVSFPDDCFSGIASYNQLMLSPGFYDKFLSYSYLLLYQLDAFAFKDELELFCDMGYDYIGALWPLGIRMSFNQKTASCYVGNGGFSLRHVEHSLQLLLELGEKVKRWPENEDVFWSFYGEVCKDKFSVAPIEVAEKFSFEQIPRQLYEKIGQLPFGSHAWYKYDIGFMREIFLSYGYHI